MRLAIIGLLYLSLLKTAAALPSNQARQDAGTQSVNLAFSSECKRHSDIEKAWDDAINLVTSLPKVDFNDVAAIDFFGPPALNKKYQSKIRAVFDSAKTFGQGWKITPAPLKVKINVGCGGDPKRELDERCSKKGGGVKAYTFNTKNSDGSGPRNYNKPDATMNMYLCNSFFDYANLADQINHFKNDQDYTHKYGLQYYTNRAYVILHEMMHANRVTYAANGNRHIVDMTMTIYKYTWNEGRNYTRRLSEVDTYGAANTKILARTNKNNIATDITLNADNFAQYVLAKYVQRQIGGYPWLPIVNNEAIGDRYPKPELLVVTNGSDWGLYGPNYDYTLTEGGNDLTFTISDNSHDNASDLSPENTLAPLTDLEWTDDDQYPSDYIKQMKEWASKAPDTPASTWTATPLTATTSTAASSTTTSSITTSSTTTSTTTAAPQPTNACHGVGGDLWVYSRDVVAANAADFCSQSSNDVEYNTGTVDDVRFSVENSQDSSQGPLDAPDCAGNFVGAVIDGCDGNDALNNPHNYKFGGTLTVGPWSYTMAPLHEQVNADTCTEKYKFLWDRFEIQGMNFPDADLGANGEGLEQHLQQCGDLTHYSFSWTDAEAPYQWKAKGHLPIGTKSCIGSAVTAAGGSSAGKCRGAG
ncbi:hypothetical protein GGR56DRAFT_659966 [Xylariaceae sp. FL0804]|nr:hypothetical protein GGR56DRAFT_659966 [Xylariaceae sp. FL0804]